MKKAIVPLTLICFIILTVFVYINRFSVYYETVDNVYVFNDDTMSSNLTGGVTAESDDITLTPVQMSEKVYSSNKKYYIGESAKKNVSLNYPIVSEDNSTLYIQSSLGKYIDSDFTKSDVAVNTIITNATLYSGATNTKVNDSLYTFLELNSGVHINLEEITVYSETHPYVIPVNSYIYFGDHYIRYYFLDGDHEFIYREIPAIDDNDEIHVGSDVYGYKDFLILMGIKSITAIVEPDNKAIEDGNSGNTNKNKSKDTLKKRGQIIETERYYTSKGEKEYIFPQIYISNFVANVYSAEFDLQIYDPQNNITSAPKFSFCIGEICTTGASPEPSFNTSGHHVVTGLIPDKDYYVKIETVYYLADGKTRGKDHSKRVYINDVPMDELTESPFYYHIKTKGTDTLNPVSFSWNNPTPNITSITWTGLKINNALNDEIYRGLSKIEIELTDVSSGKVTTLNVSTADQAKLFKGEAIDFDTKNVLKSNTVYNMKIIPKDTQGKVLKAINITKNNVKTLQKPPTATLSLAAGNSNSNLKERIIDVKIENEDGVSFNRLNGTSRFRYKVFVYKNGRETEVPGLSSYFDDYDSYANAFTTQITLSNLDILSRYYIKVYCDYVADGKTVTNYLMNKDFSVVTGDISSLGTVAFDIDNLVVSSNSVSFTARFNSLSEQIYDLLDQYINIKIYDKKNKEYVRHIVNDNGTITYSENFYVSKHYFSKDYSPGEPASFNVDHAFDTDGTSPIKYLKSMTDYKIDILPAFTSGTNETYTLNHSVSNADFTTLKQDAEVKIINAYKAAGYVDFDVCVNDPDGSIVANDSGKSYVTLNVRNSVTDSNQEANIYYTDTVDAVPSCSMSDGAYKRISINTLDKDIEDYDFTFTAASYKTNYDNSSAGSREVYVNRFKVSGAYGIVNLNKMIDTASYDLDLMSPYLEIPSEANYINMFDIRNNTRWKGQSSDSNAYDRKELLVAENTVKLGSNPYSSYGYALYIPELAGKPFTISFSATVERDISTLSASEQYFCINNGYNFSSCASGTGQGTNNIMQTIINNRNNASYRHVYSFDSLSSTGYITFFVKDGNNKRYNTNVLLKDLKIEYGKPEGSELGNFGSATNLDYGGPNYENSFVAFIDSGVGFATTEEATINVTDGTFGKVGDYDGFGVVNFNNWYQYDYYLRFFVNDVEVIGRRRKINKPVCTNNTDEDEENEDGENDGSIDCRINNFTSMLSSDDYYYIYSFVQNEIGKDVSYQVRITAVASSDGSSSFDAVTDNYYSETGVELFRLYDIYEYDFTTEIEYRSISNEDEFANMHAYGNYIVVNDLDFTNRSSGFSGTFQGSIDFQGHKVTIATGSGMKYLFGSIGGGGRVKNLDLHIIFNHRTNILSGFYGLVNSNYGQINNLMITSLNDTIDEERIAADEDLQLLNSHVEFSYDLDKGCPTVVSGGTCEQGKNSTDPRQVKSNAFKTTYSSLVAQINYGLIDGFVVKLKDPLYFHVGSSIVMSPHVAGAVNQGTIRNGYIYGEDMVAPIATTGEGRGLSLVATSAQLNAVIENIYSLVNIRIYDNEIIFTDNKSDNSKYCKEWDIVYKKNYHKDADGNCVTQDDEPVPEGETCEPDFSRSVCTSYVQKRTNNSYSASLVLGSSSNAIVRNIISKGDVFTYSDDTRNPNYTVTANPNDPAHPKDGANGAEFFVDGTTSQDQVMADAHSKRDSSINDASGSNIMNIYNISSLTYKGNISEPINKLYFKDKNFLDEVLNTHNVFLTQEAWKSNIYPHLDMPSCMPTQDYVKIDSASASDGVFKIMSVDSVVQDGEKFATGFKNSNTYRKNYFAEIKLSVLAPTGKRIVGVVINDINRSGYSTDFNKIAVEWGGKPNSDGLTTMYLYIKEPSVYKNSYVLSDIYYNDDGSPNRGPDTKYCGGTGDNSGAAPNGALECVDGALDVQLPISLYKKVSTIEEIYTGINERTVNFLLTKDIDCSNDRCNFNGSKPFIENVVGLIDGGGHTIKNLETNNCLFGTLSGTIKNLNIDKYTNNYANNNYGNYGGLVCIMNNGARIDNVSMKDVTVGAGGSGAVYVGGLVGHSKGGFIQNISVLRFRMIEYAKNANGETIYDQGEPVVITNNMTKLNNSSTLYAGGLVGYGQNLIISNGFVRNINLNIPRYSVADGKTTYGPGDAPGIGGVIGYLHFGNIEDVYSTGDITSSFNSTGGIAGTNGGYIKNCISKVNIIGNNYVGAIAGTVSDTVIPSNKVAKTLALGDVLVTSTESKDIHRTAGSLIASNGNYAWKDQSFNSVYTEDTSGETLLSGEDMLNPLVFSNRIGLSEENWVLNYNYSDYCTLGTDNTSRCEDGHFKQAFRYGYYIDSINGENVQYGYIPMVKNFETGKPLPNQGFYEGEEGYEPDESDKLVDLEIRFVQMFSIKELEVKFFEKIGTNGEREIFNPDEYYKADFAKVVITMLNPNKLSIKSLDITDMTIDGEPVIENSADGKMSTVSIKVVPRYYYDSYQINSIIYENQSGARKTYTAPILLNISFYGKINSVTDWNAIVPGRAQNYLVESDIDFNCFNSSCNVVTGLTFNKLKGRKIQDGDTLRNPVIKNIKKTGMGGSTGLIDNVTTSLQDIDFENIYLESTGGGSNFGLIKVLDGVLYPTQENSVMKFTNIRIAANSVNNVGIIGTNRSNKIRDIQLKNINVTGYDDVGALIGYSQLKEKTNIKLENVYVKGNNYVGGFIGLQDDAKGRYYDSDITVDGLYVYGASYVGGLMGLGDGVGINIKGENLSYPTNMPGDLRSNITSSDKLNTIYGTGNYVGGALGSTYVNNTYNIVTESLNINGRGTYTGGVTGANRTLYNVQSKYNVIHGNYRVGGITGHSSWDTSNSIGLSNTIIADNEYAGGIAGGLGWSTISKCQVTNDSSHPVYNNTVIRAKKYAGGVVGGIFGQRSYVHNNISSAIIASNGSGYVGGIVGYVNNSKEYENNTYIFSVYNNIVENSIIASEASLAGGLIGGWDKDSVVGSTTSWSRYYNNSISASIYCRDISYCGFINGGSKNSGQHNGDYLATSHYVVNRNYDHLYKPGSYEAADDCKTKIGSTSGITRTVEGGEVKCYLTVNATRSEVTENGVTTYTYSCPTKEGVSTTPTSNNKCKYDFTSLARYHNTNFKPICKSANKAATNGVYNGTNITIPDGNGLQGSWNGTWCNWKYAEADIDLPYVYRDIKINEDTVLGKVSGTTTDLIVRAYQFKSIPEENTNSYDLYNGTKITTGKIRRQGKTELVYHAAQAWSTTLANLNNTPSATGNFTSGDSTYFPYLANAPTIMGLNNFPNNYKIAKNFHKPQATGNEQYYSLLGVVINNMSLLPRVSVYAVDVNKINVEFNDVGVNNSFIINGQEYSIDRKTYTFYYDFDEDFDITVNSPTDSETITISAEDVVNNSTTIGDNYYYLDEDGNIISNTELKSNGFEEQEVTVDNPSDDNSNNIDSGLVTTSSINNKDMIYKLVEMDKTTEINNATNIYGDQILLDNKNIYNITTGKTKVDDFENLTLADDTALYDFTYAGQEIKTYGSYSTIDGEVVEKQLFLKNNKIEVVENGLDSVGNSYIIDNYNGKEYMIYLGVDGKIHSLKDQIVLPKGFKNINIKSISTTVGTNTNIIFVEYEDGSYIAFNYRNGNVVGSETNKDVSLGEYIKQYYQLSKDKNNYSEENANYLAAKELVNKLNEHPIETIADENYNYSGIPSKNANYSIVYNPTSNDYYVYQLPTAESTADIRVSDSFNETVDSMIDRDEKLIEFYREGKSTKVTLVSALIIVLVIVGFIGLAIIVLARYLGKNQKIIKEGI